MHPATGFHRLRGVSDGHAVLDDLSALWNRVNGHLMTLWDVLPCDEVNVIDLDFVPLRNWSDGHDNIVLWADMHYLCSCHSIPPEKTGRSSHLFRPMMSYDSSFIDARNGVRRKII
ncbi:MAG TPA: hypothetical protein DD632_04270 [Oribacterium sp.]|nr:hypothetical protein [Oribacterium sp.]